MFFNEIMILEDVSLTAQETEIFWLATGRASHGSAAGHQAYFSGLRQIGPSESAVCLFTQLLSPGCPATISTSCEGELSDGEMARVKAAPTPQPAATKHHSPIKSLCSYRPNQAPIKDTPSSTLLTSLSSLLPSINNETTNQVCPMCYFDQAKKKKKNSLCSFTS